MPQLMILDPDRAFAAAVARFFRDRGYQAATIADGPVFSSLGSDAAVVLCDICPRGVPQLGLLNDLRARRPLARIVVVTAYPSVSVAIASIRSGADDFLIKPLDPAEIWAALQPRSGTLEDETSCFPSLARIEWEYTSRVLTSMRGNLSATARVLGIRRSTLQRRLQKYPPAR